MTSNSQNITRTKYMFFVHVPDHDGPDALARREAHKAKHIQGAQNLLSGGLKYGGAVFSPETYNTENKITVGSMMIFEAESIEAVRQTIERDKFFTANVWDTDKIKILPFISPFSLPKITYTDETRH